MAEPDHSVVARPGATAAGNSGAGLLATLSRGVAAITGTMAFRHASVSVAALVLAGAIVMWLLYGTVNDIMARSVVETMTVEADGLAAVATVGGPEAVVAAIAARSRAEPARLYLLQSTAGTKLAGNLDRWPAELTPNLATSSEVGGTFHFAVGEEKERLAAGVIRTVPGEMRLLVARDLADQRQLAASVRWLFLVGFGALAMVGLGAGLLASHLALSRVAEITATSDAIMAGDFSGRIKLSGADDELDHLSGNLNAMLDRVEQLMAGLREVSDNIAHDLKTPLSRLRSRAEAALRAADAGDGAAAPHEALLREALGQVIEDADELIKTFNALLLIARLEAGTLADTAETFDLGALVRDVAELYAPVAEEAGLALACDAVDGATVHANRQLIGQAIANLIDNAIKYGQPAAGDKMPAAGEKVPAAGENGPIGEIEVGLHRQNGEALIVVADHGPGIPAVDRERVLRRFVRLDASRTRPGTGLGLSLVAAVARLLGGSVRLEDNAPGLRIILVLPCRA